MSLYRVLIAAVAALCLSFPAFADEDVAATPSAADNTQTIQLADNSQAADQGSTTVSTDSATTTLDQTKVNVNKATTKELMKIKGLTAAKAKAIVAYRKKHGDFKSLDDLKLVKGFKKISDDKMKQIQDQLTIG